MIRRPLLYMAAAMSAAIFICYYVDVLAGVISLSIFILWAFVISNTKGRFIIIVGFVAGMCSFLVWNSLPDSIYSDVREAGTLGLQAVTLEGDVINVDKGKSENGDEYINFVVRPKSIKGKKIAGFRKILVKSYDKKNMGIVPGDNITICGNITLPKGKRNPGCFDYRLYLKSRGITVCMTASRIRVNVISKHSISRFAFIKKEKFTETVRNIAGERTEAIITGIMFGDKGKLEDDILESFQRNGTAHILAVSGLHVGIIYSFILKIWNFLGFRRRWNFFFSCGSFFIFYMFMADFSPSIVRAVVMVMMHVFAQIKNKRYDINSAAFLVVMGNLAVNPYMLFNVGFQMSFLAVLTIILIVPYVRKVTDGILLSGIAVQIGLTPFMMYTFNCLSLLSIFINIPVIAIVGLIVPLGLCDMFIQNLICIVGGNIAFELLYELMLKVTSELCELLVWLNDITECEGVTNFTVGSPKVWMVFFYYFLILILFSEEGRLKYLRNKSVKYVAMVLMISLMMSFVAYTCVDDGFRNANVVFVDVGQGDCIHIKTGKRNYLIDGGGSVNFNVGSSIIKPYLLKSGITHIDGALVTHLHTDHYKGICELAREGFIDYLYVYSEEVVRISEIVNETGIEAERIVFLKRGNNVLIAGKDKDSVSIEVLWPETSSLKVDEAIPSDDENSSCLVFRVNYQETKILVTGDIDERCEKELMKSDIRADILKVPHHGSKYSSCDDFIEAVNPSISVIQVGKNVYGHPSYEVLERMERRGIAIYRNDLNGAIGIEIEKGKIKKIRTMIKQTKNKKQHE